ncbi:MAG TPA: type I restriction-modification system subunit M N-terminal domain-containing protein [Rhodocyclaceae bacterium]|nr:type I restriction-modification system subunit M N-terminal domain-containing protein [Rhodocyclaceae bacterium]
MPGTRKSNDATAATLGYEAQLWQMADALRGSMDAAEYKNVCLGLLFLKYATWRLARMILAIRGLDSGRIAQGDTFHNERRTGSFAA